jgi:cytochrome c
MRACLFLFFTALFLIPTASAGPLHDAAKTGDSAAIIAALDAGEDINAKVAGSSTRRRAANRGRVCGTLSAATGLR